MSHNNPNLREIYMMDPGRPVDLLLSLRNHFVTICFIHPSKLPPYTSSMPYVIIQIKAWSGIPNLSEEKNRLLAEKLRSLSINPHEF